MMQKSIPGRSPSYSYQHLVALCLLAQRRIKISIDRGASPYYETVVALDELLVAICNAVQDASDKASGAYARRKISGHSPIYNFVHAVYLTFLASRREIKISIDRGGSPNYETVVALDDLLIAIGRATQECG